MNQMAQYTQNLSLLNPLSIWNSETNLVDLKNIYGKNLTDVEFQTFVKIGMSTGLNPFLRELWAVKFGSTPASIFIGRDGYRKSAQNHPEYDYHNVDAIYSNDEFGNIDGRIVHKYNMANRGVLVAAYCIVKRRSASREQYVVVQINEYNKNQSVWKEKPETMIKKVAEAQALRMAFQELFGGTYHEYEQWKIEREQVKVASHSKGMQGLKERLGLIKIDDQEISNVNSETGEITEEKQSYTFEELNILMKESKNMDELIEAAKHVSNFDESEKEKLREVFKQKKDDIVANFINQ